MQRYVVRVAGCDITYQRRRPPHVGPPVLLIHGAGGHAGWWRGVVPHLRTSRDVVLVELSGHGDSGHRDIYDIETWSAELAAIIEELGQGSAAIVGHSVGGLVALHAAGRHHRHIRGVIAVDSAVIPYARTSRSRGDVKFYATVEQAVSNFRLRPRATAADPLLLTAVARAGLRQEPRGWRWKFDPQAMQRIPRDLLEDAIQRIQCPVAFVYGKNSQLAGHSTVEHLEQKMGRCIPNIAIDKCFHHVPLDAPAKTAAAIEILLPTLLADSSEPAGPKRVG